MAYDKSEIKDKAVVAIEEYELTTIPEVLCYLPCDESTLYSTDEWKIEVLEPIKKALELKKTSLKAKMKRDWRKSDSNPTLQIAAFKLIANEEELTTLSTSKVLAEHSGNKGGPIQTETKHVVEFHDFTGKGNTTEV